MAASLAVTTLARLKDGQKIEGLVLANTTVDAILTDLINEVSTMFERYIGHQLLSAARTEVYDVLSGTETIFLREFPVTALTSVKLRSSVSGDFADVTALDATNYEHNPTTGELHFTRPLGWTGRRLLQVVYTAGVDTSTANLIANNPDIPAAADRQIAYMFLRRNRPGAGGLQIAGGSVQHEVELDLLKTVKRTLNQYKTIVI